MWNRRKECILPRKLYFLPHLVQPTFAKTVNLIWSKSQTPAKRLSVHAYMEQRVELTSSPATQQVYVYSTGENQLSTEKRHTVAVMLQPLLEGQVGQVLPYGSERIHPSAPSEPSGFPWKNHSASPLPTLPSSFQSAWSKQPGLVSN